MSRSTLVKLGFFVLVVLGIGWGLRAAGFDIRSLTPERVRAYVLSFGALAPLIYLGVYCQPLVPLPASLMTIAGGLAFGPLWGTLAALCGATVRACGQFFVAKLLGRETVARLLKGQAVALDQKIGANGFTTVLLIRLIPNVPFDMQNYGLGFSQVRFGPYAVATFLGMIPGSFAFVYLGYSLTDLRQAWKLAVALLVIISLILAQRQYAKRR